MDTGEGRFITANDIRELEEKFNEYPKHGGIFTVGEEIKIKGSLFTVKKITKKDIVLRLKRR